MTVCKSHLGPILQDEALTRGLSDPEARILVEWLVDRAELATRACEDAAWIAQSVEQSRRLAKAIARFVALWSDKRTRGAACQLAACERFPWPLPTTDVDPCELMLEILSYYDELQ